MSILVGGKNFKTKTSLLNYCKYALNNAELNKELTGEWNDVMRDVLSRHEDFTEKTLGGVFEIRVRQCFMNARNRQFYIIREDGSDTDFSYRKCVSPTSKSTEIKATLRAAIRYQVESYKTEYFLDHADSLGYIRCPETNLKVKKAEAHIDHYPLQFDEIVKIWVDKNDVESSQIKLVSNGDNSAEWDMEDKELLQSFIDIHQKYATYRVVLNKVNMQRGKSKRYSF